MSLNRLTALAGSPAQSVATGSARRSDPAATGANPRITAAVARARDALLGEQHGDGHWCGELEGDSILQSEYLLLMAWLGREREPDSRAAANYLLEQQNPDGGWSLYPGGPTDVSGSVKAVLALRLSGPKGIGTPLAKAREAILAAGGAERVNSFTRYYLALLGQIAYRQCPAVPPELILVPGFSPLNLREMSAWSRTIVVPLSLLWAFQPSRDLPAEGIDVRDLFLRSPEELPVMMPPSEAVERELRSSRVDWHELFGTLDRVYKLCDRVRLNPLRRTAVRRAERWMLDRFEDSDGLGAIFPPIVWSVVALRCLGYAEDSPEVHSQLDELDRLKLREGDTVRLQPCKSPVWDTALATIALREAGVPAGDDSIRSAATWLVEKEVRTPGDWAQTKPKLEPSGWFFEYRNRFYADVDDTAMVLMALARCLPARSGTDWHADLGLGEDGRTVIAGRGAERDAALSDVHAAAPLTAAIRRGLNWLIGMQGRDGGWGAFDADNDRELFCRVPFADHNAMIDPSTADLTARVLELYGLLGLSPDLPSAAAAIDYVTREQESDGSWYGRWGVNHLYGTWQGLLGLAAVGCTREDGRVIRAVRWLKEVQRRDGGFGETPASYDDPSLRGTGPTTASQTAWGLMGLIAGGAAGSDAARRAAHWLAARQTPEGTWDEPEFTGTGFPCVFYLRYHMYRLYFPLMALSRYERAVR